MTLIISNDKFGKFREYLEKNGYAFEDRPYQQFLAKRAGFVVNLYTNGKIVFGGNNQTERTLVEQYLNSLQVSNIIKPIKEYPPIEVSGTRIGTDEVGKGDYFGPLIIGGVLATESQCKILQALGVRDSKDVSDTAIDNLALEIRRVLNPNQRKTLPIGPAAYNRLHKQMKSVNRILGWGHARVIEDLLASNPTCETAVADQFGDESYIKSALMKKGRTINLIQTHKGEREISVAAASILARLEFIYQMRQMSLKYKLEFPKGATNVIPTADEFVKTYGGLELINVAKVDFITTRKISNLTSADLQALASKRN